MIFLGGSATHGQKVHFGDIDALDGLAAYTLLVGIRLSANPADNNTILSKYDPSTDNNGWGLRFHTGNKFNLVHGDGASFLESGTNTTALSLNTSYMLGVIWDASDVTFLVDGAEDGSAAYTKSVSANAHDFVVGNISGAASQGVPGALVNVAVFDDALPVDVVAAMSLGRIHPMDYPALAPVFFCRFDWAHGSKDLVDRVSSTAWTLVSAVAPGGDIGGDPALGNRADPLDTLWADKTIPAHRAMASYHLRRNSVAQPVYFVDTLLHYAGRAALSVIQLAHDSALRPASFLTNLSTHNLMDVWRRATARVVDKSIVRGGTDGHNFARLGIKDLENFAASHWSTERLPDGFNEALDGLAEIDVGGTVVTVRANAGYVQNPSFLVSTLTNGTAMATVPPHMPKMNHVGFIAEESAVNPIENPSWADGYDSVWTRVTTISPDTLNFGNGAGKMFVDPDLSNSAFLGGFGETVEPYYQQSGITVLSTDGYRRLDLYYSMTGPSSDGNFKWKLQRASDSLWWNDSTESWGAEVWNDIPNNFDSAAPVQAIERFVSNPITSAENTTWTLRLGVTPQGSNPASVGGYLYHSQLPAGKFRYTPIPVYDTATEADTRRRLLVAPVPATGEEARQLVYAGRGYFALTVTAEQNAADLEDEDQLCLAYWQYGDTELDFDALIYEKPTGGNARFALVHYIAQSGAPALDASSTLEVDIVRGQTYTVVGRFTSAADGELELPARSYLVEVNGVNGSADQASALHDVQENHTEIWYGCAPDSVGFKRSMNWVAPVVAVPRVKADEEAA